MNMHALRREAHLDALNATEMASEHRPVRMSAASFDVWQILPSGKAQPHLVQAETLADIERAIATEAYHGCTFMVRETATLSRIATVHSYRVRKGKAVGWDRDAKRTYAYTADKLFAVEVAAFEPVEPWRCVPGADRVGGNGIIEGRRA
jgi:hypothetical protein